MKVRLKHERLARALAESPVTLNRWAQRMGLRSGHLSQLANGRRPYPTARTRRKLLDALGLGFDDLFEVEAPTPASPAPVEPRRFSEDGAPQPRPRQHDLGRQAGMSGWWLDLRFAVRGLAKRPGYAAAAVLTLALGIGVNLTIFSVVNAILLKSLPHRDPDRLFVAFTTTAERDGQGNFSWPDYLDFRERLEGVMDLAVWDWEPFSLAGGDRPMRVEGGRVTSNFAQIVGVDMLRGRFFSEAERVSDESLLVIGERLWRSSFGADEAIVGREVILDGRAATIVGVAPSHLDVISDVQIFVPLRASAEPRNRRFHWLDGHARLAPGVTEAQARDRFRAVAAELAAEYPEHNEGRSADILSLRESRIGNGGRILLLLLGVAVAILLIVCANVANLLLARGAARRHEISVRAALGADRLRLARQLMTESGLLTVLGLGLGALAAVAGRKALLAFGPETTVPPWADLSLDFRVLAFAVGVAGGAMLLFGGAPAILQSRALAPTARSGRAATAGGWSVKRLLVVAQVAISFVLLVGSGLMLQSSSR